MPIPLTPAEMSLTLKALAEPNRLRIFKRLLEGDSCNCELGDELALAPNLLSHHLRVLSKAGLVQSRRDRVDGRWIYYTVDVEQVTMLRSWLLQLLDTTRLELRPVLCGPEGQLEEAAYKRQTVGVNE